MGGRLVVHWHEISGQKPKTSSKDTALMCQEVGSLWRVHWEELAAQLLDDENIDLDPPDDE